MSSSFTIYLIYLKSICIFLFLFCACAAVLTKIRATGYPGADVSVSVRSPPWDLGAHLKCSAEAVHAFLTPEPFIQASPYFWKQSPPPKLEIAILTRPVT